MKLFNFIKRYKEAAKNKKEEKKRIAFEKSIERAFGMNYEDFKVRYGVTYEKFEAMDGRERFELSCKAFEATTGLKDGVHVRYIGTNDAQLGGYNCPT